MGFEVSASAYDRFMGRYSAPLAPVFCDFAELPDGMILDVGCGPGALTTELVRRVGTRSVCAIDPSEPFVAALRERQPGVDVRRAAAEAIDAADGAFAASLAQLVVHFMADPVAGLSEMARVTAPGGVVAACVWDHAGDGGPLSLFWEGARRLDGTVGEAELAGARAGHLTELFHAAGVRDVVEQSITVQVTHASFDEWWEPFTLGVGPAGEYVAGLDPLQRRNLSEWLRGSLPTAPFVVTATAWAARGSAPSV